MNISVSAAWIVLYYFISGSILWYFAGYGLDQLWRWTRET
jgi:hypothetical protein